MIVMAAAMSLIPVMDGLAKLLSARYPTLEIVWARNFFHFALLLPLVLWRHGRQSLRMQRPGLQIFRGSLLMALAAGTIYPFYVLVTRKMAGGDPPLVTLLMTGLVGTVVMSALGALAADGHYGIIVAHEWASAAQPAPFGFAEIVAATVGGM